MTIDILAQRKIDEFRVAGKLPSPGGVALAIMEKCQQDGVTVQEIAHLVSSDPALSGRLIQYANSAWSSGRRPVASVPEAVHRVGLSAVRHLVLGFSLISSTHYVACAGFDYERFWARSLAMAIASRSLSLQTRISAEESFTFGLLCEIGQLALAGIYPDSYGQVLETAGNSGKRLLQLENEHYAIDRKVLTYALLKDWGFPNIFLETGYYHDDPESAPFEKGTRQHVLIHGLHLASCLADTCLLAPEDRQARLQQLFPLAVQLGGEAEELLGLSDNIVTDWREWGHLVGIRTQGFSATLECASEAPSAPVSDVEGDLGGGAISARAGRSGRPCSRSGGQRRFPSARTTGAFARKLRLSGQNGGR